MRWSWPVVSRSSASAVATSGRVASRPRTWPSASACWRWRQARARSAALLGIGSVAPLIPLVGVPDAGGDVGGFGERNGAGRGPVHGGVLAQVVHCPFERGLGGAGAEHSMEDAGDPETVLGRPVLEAQLGGLE